MAPNIILDKETAPLNELDSQKSVDSLSPDQHGVVKFSASDSHFHQSSIVVDTGSVVSKMKTKNHSPETDKMTLPLALGALLALFTGSIPSGYNVGAVNTPQQVLVTFCNSTLTDRGVFMSTEKLALLWSVAVSILLLGAITATSFTNQLANSAGRKGAILISGFIGIIGSLLFLASYYFKYIELFLLARLISGIHSGLTSGLVPLYIAELSPEKLKGSMGVLHTFGLNFGMLIAAVLGQETLLGSQFYWPILLSLPCLFIVIGLTIYRPSPSSPVYLYIVKRKFSKAANALAYLRRLPVSTMEEEIGLLQKERKQLETNKSEWTFVSLMLSSDYHKLVLLVLLLHIGQQFSGINAVFYYSTLTFLDLGMTMSQAQYGSIALVCINVVASMIVIPLLKKCRRRSLMFTSLWGGIICLIGLTITTKIKDLYSWAPIATLAFFFGFVLLFALGNGTIPWMIAFELLPKSTLGVVTGFGGLFNWVANFTVALSFPIANNWLGDSVFLIFVAFGIFEGIVIYLHLPETGPCVTAAAAAASEPSGAFSSASSDSTVSSPLTSPSPSSSSSYSSADKSSFVTSRLGFHHQSVQH